ncbi:MAG: FtsH protease activity modulator HflK [Cellulosilyticaceae bacterium]
MNQQDPKDIIIDIPLSKALQNIRKYIKGIAFFFILAILFLASIYRLETGTVGVITRFGAIQQVNESAGIHFRLPFIDQVQIVDVQTVHKMEYGYRTAESGDTQYSPEYTDQSIEEQVIVEAEQNNASIILLNLIVRFQIDNPVNFLYQVDDIEGTMRLALEDVIRSTLPVFSINEALANKELIDEAILPKLQAKLDKYNTGIKIVQVTTQNVSLLPAVEETRQKVEEANQYKKGRQEEAQKYANTILPKANAEATKLLEDAKGYSAEIIASANADVAEFEALYSEYVKNPQLVKEKYYIEAMQEVLNNNQLVIDQTKDGNLLKFFDVNNGGQ